MNVSRVSNNPLWRFLDNPYPRPDKDWLNTYIPGKEVKEINDVKNIKREDKQYFFPKENKTANHTLDLHDFIDLQDISEEKKEELKKIFHEKWVNDLFTKKKKYADYYNALTKSGYTDELSRVIIDYGIQNIDRIKNWAYENEKVGERASNLMSFGVFFGIIRNLIHDFDFVSPFVKKLVSFSYALMSSLRGYYQYSKQVYDRPDDEAAMNRYQAKEYGNKIAGSFGTLACFMETKVNPFILPITSLFQDKNVFDNTFSLSTIPNISWWRARMPGHINQEYLTDLFRYLWHGFLSLFGIKRSQRIIEEIKERKNLELGYIAKRHYENIGLKKKEEQKPLKFISELFKNIRNTFNKDTKVQQESAKKAGETIAPVFGFTAFISTTIGIPLKLISKALDKQSRITDFFTSLSLSCQQCIYFFKMIVPAICNIKKTKELITKNENYINKDKLKELDSLKILLGKHQKLAWLGISTFLASILNSILKIFKTENQYFEKAKSIVEGLGGDLVSKFFSQRRHVLGYQFKAENPEFYEEAQEQITDTNENNKPNEQTSSEDSVSPQNIIPLRALPTVSKKK